MGALTHKSFDLRRLNDDLATASAGEIIQWARDTFGDQLVFTSSLGLEDQVVTDILFEHAPDVEVAFIDTGRLFAETYTLWDRTRNRYPLRYRTYFPQARAVEEMVDAHGPNLFFDSVEQRKRCCHVRKVEPLQRALAGKSGWITGLRRLQSSARQDIDIVEWDAAQRLLKINPLCHWDDKRLAAHESARNVPYNPLHDRGFPSIGCAPCTRAVATGENPRSGRWWWESDDQRECGLHLPIVTPHPVA